MGSTSIDTVKSGFGSNKHCLKVCHVNVESIIAHRDNFLDIFSDCIFDVIVVSETFLKPAISFTPYLLNSYNVIRHDREGKEGGGLLVYIKTNVKYKVLTTSEAKYCSKPEYVILELSCLNWKLLLCAFYRPPKIGHLDELYNLIGNILPVYDNFFMLGDINIDLSSVRNFPDKVQFQNALRDMNLNVLPLNTTHHRPDSDTWLDVMVTNDVSKVVKFGQTAVSGMSYHDLIYVQLNLSVKCNIRKGKIAIRDFKNLDTERLKRECISINWEQLYGNDNIDSKVEILEDNLLLLLDNNVPLRNISNKKKLCPWITPEIKALMKNRDVLYRRYVRTKDRDDWERYRLERNIIKRMIRDARNSYFESSLSSNKSGKDVWKNLRDHGSGKEVKQVGAPVVNLNDLNNFFCGIENNINDELFDYYRQQKSDEDCFNFSIITENDVSSVLNKISSNAIGNDRIPLKLIRLVFSEIKEVLCHVFNYSLMNSVYPRQWKRALILPLPKINNPVECKNYRSINILCVLGKILDKLVYKQVYEYVNSKNILYKFQSGYRSGYSTQTALVKVTDDLRKAIDERKLTVLMLLDFSRAFDCVNHKLLLSILESCSFDSIPVRWFDSYLDGREQKIRSLDNVFSEWKVNPVGVPQGSTLSALLFSLYINKIHKPIMFSQSMLYADDMQLYISSDVKNIDNAISLLNADLTMLYSWCRDHGLNLNVAKCKPMIVGHSRLLSNLNLNEIRRVAINNEELVYERSFVNLGLRMTNSLSWSEQVGYVHKKVYQCLYQFKKLYFKPSLEIKKLLISTLVLPYFDYAIVAYCDVNSTLITKLQRAQNACIRYIFNLRLDDHVTPYFKQLGWLKIKEKLEFSMVTLMNRIMTSKQPNYLFEKYNTLHDVHLRETRFGNTLLRIPIHRTEIYNKSFHVSSIRLFNSLDTNVKEADSEQILKRRLKSKLLERY